MLDLLDLPSFVGGSVASGSYGLARQTNDIDFIADFRNLELAAFCELLKRDFYVDLQSVVKPRQGRPFNAIHLKSAVRSDFFPADSDAYSQAELGRKRLIVSAIPGLENIEFPILQAQRIPCCLNFCGFEKAARYRIGNGTIYWVS